MQALRTAATGMAAQQLNVEVISNNIANMTTTGFKRRRAEFQDLIYQNLRRVGSNSSDSGSIVPSGAQVGLGVKTAAIYRINTQGDLQSTGNPFQNVRRIRDQQCPCRGPDNDQQFRRLDQNFNVAFFHQESADNRPKN